MNTCSFLLATFATASLLGAQSATRDPALVPRIVRLENRPFDLHVLREAISKRKSARAIDAIVADLEARAQEHQAPLRRWVEQRGGKVAAQWWLINGFAIELPARHVNALAQLEVVAAVTDNRLAYPGWIRTATNFRNHRVNQVHGQGIQGKGVTIAVLDSGLDSRYRGGSRPHRTFFIDGDPTNTAGGGLSGSRLLANVQVGAQPADDILGHGTMVAAIAAGENWGTSFAGPGHAPKASLVGYSIADQPNGAALLSTIISALQSAVADRMRYGTRVLNLSYEGTNVPTAVEQQALDAAVLTGDLLIAVLAGNGGSSNQYSHAATNVIAVGLARNNAHQVHSVSSRGPLQGNRTFPDIVANGEQTIGPLRDDEASNRISTGTSNAAPQVAGAAALYRSLRPAATALETKAALLATTEDIRQYNPNGTANDFGQGYLRDDTLVSVAQGNGAVHNDPLTPAAPSRSYTFPVTAGKDYAGVVCWFRYDTNLSSGWSDLSLSVRDGSTVWASSDAPLNLYEKVSFRATRSGTVTFTVTAKTFEAGITSLPTSLVLLETPPPPRYAPGSVAQFGTPCRGSLKIFNTPVTNGINFLGKPTIGAGHDVQIARVLPNTPVALVLGLSRTRWGGNRLPIDLTPLGGTGCSIYVSLDRILMLRSTATTVPSVTRTFTIPNDATLIGWVYFLQGAGADAPGNPMGMTTTAGLEVKIGN